MSAARGLARRWFSAPVVALTLVGTPPVAGQSLPIGTFSLVAIHPEAAAYPSYGDSLVGLTPWRGRLYTGYGHWVQFPGILDFAIRAYDPGTNQLVSRWVTKAEALWSYRPIGDKLYVPLTDPSDIDYVFGEPWQDRDVLSSATRLFDVATFNGTDLLLMGSTGADAVAWRSSDGGQTWQESLRVSKQDPNDMETHFSFAMVVGGKLYVQAYGVGRSGAHLSSKVFDGTTWSEGPNLLPDWRYKGWKPTAFGDEIVYLSGEPGNASLALLRFDGVQATEVQTPFRPWDFFVAGDYLYALVVDPGAPLWAPDIRRTRDLTTWTDVAVAPTNSRSIGILGQSLYVGATEGRLFKYTVPLLELAPRRGSRRPAESPETTS